MPSPTDTTTKVRLDQWLWAARFFKTRSLAAQAITGHKVHLNDATSKPAKEVHLNDTLVIAHGQTRSEVRVLGVASVRRSAADAVLLYEESAASLQAKAQAQLMRRIAPEPAAQQGRPSKRDRRQWQALQG